MRFQAFAILAGSFIFVVYFEEVGLFPSGEGETAADSGTGGRAGPEHADVLDGLAIEELETHFRELGLRPGSSQMIAALLARKTPDTTICDNLDVSPSTLKTHAVRNVAAGLAISRTSHELAWLVTANPAGISETQGGGR